MYHVVQECFVDEIGQWLLIGMELEPDALDPEVTAELVYAGVLVLEGQPFPPEPEPLIEELEPDEADGDEFDDADD